MSKDKVLENFMKEFIPFEELQRTGFFTKEMKGDYEAQAERVRKFFGYKTVYQYGAKEITCHLSFTSKRPEGEPFVTTIKSIYE